MVIPASSKKKWSQMNQSKIYVYRRRPINIYGVWTAELISGILNFAELQTKCIQFIGGFRGFRGFDWIPFLTQTFIVMRNVGEVCNTVFTQNILAPHTLDLILVFNKSVLLPTNVCNRPCWMSGKQCRPRADAAPLRAWIRRVSTIIWLYRTTTPPSIPTPPPPPSLRPQKSSWIRIWSYM